MAGTTSEIRHKVVISGEKEYKKALSDMSAQLREAKSEVKATAAEMDAQGKSTDTLSSQLAALQRQHELENRMLEEMQRHLAEVVEATGEESREAVTLRTRINAMRTEAAQTSGQLSRLTSELDEAAGAAAGLGDSAAADGIRGLGDAADAAAGDLGGIQGILSKLGEGITIGIGANVGQNVLNGITGAVKEAVTRGWTEAMESQADYNRIGIATGTAGTATNDYLDKMADRLKLALPSFSMGDIQGALADAYTFLPSEVFENEERLYNLLTRMAPVAQATGVSLGDMIQNARQLNTVFGTDFEDSVAVLYSAGTGMGSSGGVEALTEYALTWKSLGMDASQAAGTLDAAAGLGVMRMGDVGKAVREANSYLGDFTANKDGLEKMGLLATDLGTKFQMGGEDAATAMQLLLRQFLSMDSEVQNEIGPQLFGAGAWERYGTTIAQAMLQGYESTLTDGQRQAVEDAREALTFDLGSQLAITDELINQALAEEFAPAVDLATHTLKGANDAGAAAKEGGAHGVEVFRAWLGGLWDGFHKGAAEVTQENMDRELGEGWTTDDLADAVVAEIWNDPQVFWDLAGGKGEEAGETAAEAFAEGAAEGFEDGLTEQPEPEPLIDPGTGLLGTLFPDLFGGGSAVPPDAREAAEVAGGLTGEEAAAVYAEAFGSHFTPVEVPGMTMFGRTPTLPVADWMTGLTPPTETVEQAADEAGEDAGAAAAEAYTEAAAEGFALMSVPGMTRFGRVPTLPIADWMVGLVPTETVEQAADEAGEDAGEAAAEAYTEAAAEGFTLMSVPGMTRFGRVPTLPIADWMVGLVPPEEVEQAAADAGDTAGETAGETVAETFAEAVADAAELSVTDRIHALNADIEAEMAKETPDWGLVESLKAERDALIPLLWDTDKEVGNIQVTVTDTATGVTEAVESGFAPLPGAAQDSVDGMMGVLSGAKFPAYQAGWDAGAGFNAGYRDALGIHSPSAVMREAAEYTLAGLDDGLARTRDLTARGAALADALRGGVIAGGGGAAYAGGTDARASLEGMAVVMDGEIVGRLTERSVSETGYARAAGTIQGRTARVRGW